MLSVNELAQDIVEEMLDYSDEYREQYGIEFQRLKNGAWVIDFGVNVKGSISAGILFSEVCMAGLAEVNVKTGSVGNLVVPFVEVRTDNPVLACLASQKAGWQIKVDNYFAMGSGPARALALKPKKTYELIDYEDDAEYAVITLESDLLPDERVVDYIAEECDVESEDVYVLVAPTSSLVGSIQISARIVEVAMYRLLQLGFDVKKIFSGCGNAPVAPLSGDSLKAMGMTNDCLLYYGSAFLFSEFDESEMDMIDKANLTSDSSKDYGKPFYEVFKDSNYNFYEIDPNLFSPARITISSPVKLISKGRLNVEVLLKSFGVIS